MPHHHIIIAGAGGIGEAAALLLGAWSETSPVVYIGDIDEERAKSTAARIAAALDKPFTVSGFAMQKEGISPAFQSILEKSDVLLDCLPGKLAPVMAGLAKEFGLHYANLTEYVHETDQILHIAEYAETGFILQTGLAPGYIGVLANGLFRRFCNDFGVDQVDKMEMKVGALTDHAVAPHYYGFTWSTIGVATEYIKDAVVIRNFQKTSLPSLSETSRIIIDGVDYEDDLTSGGAADLPDALAGRVKTLDYKTLRHPGHYAWVRAQLKGLPEGTDTIRGLQDSMESQIPHVENDRIILYAAVEGKDAGGTLRRREVSKLILPKMIGNIRLRAIQTTTAAPLLQSAMMLLENKLKGPVLQSQIDPETFLNGHFIREIYGTTELG